TCLRRAPDLQAARNRVRKMVPPPFISHPIASHRCAFDSRGARKPQGV
ncbi:hypothetical protein CEXT_727031, partial [Caerostris extrusa]